MPNSVSPYRPLGGPLSRETRAPVKVVRRPFRADVGSTVAKRYRLTKLIGRGGMGNVYSAIDLETGLEVALKTLNVAAFTSKNLRRFRREAEAASIAKHRNICAVHYLGVELATPFIVMEHLSGETLCARMRKTGALALSDAITIAVQILDGLEAVHAVGILHRDIKPANVFLVTPRGRTPSVKIIDFGLAKPLPPSAWFESGVASNDEEVSTLTAIDIIPGTPFYLSPEQLNGVRDLDERVDVWAAALTLYEMLIGKRAYTGASFIEIAARIVTSPVPCVNTLRSDAPRGLAEVLAVALAVDRDDRFRTVRAFRAALVDIWSRYRAEGLSRAAGRRKFRLEAETLADDVEIEGRTIFDGSIDVDI